MILSRDDHALLYGLVGHVTPEPQYLQFTIKSLVLLDENQLMFFMYFLTETKNTRTIYRDAAELCTNDI